MIGPTQNLYWRLAIRDQNGKVVHRGRWRRARSYVKQYTQLLRCMENQADESSVTDTGGTSRTLDISSMTGVQIMSLIGSSGSSLWGPVIGTGSTAVAISDNTLTQIAHGTSAGQMEHALASAGSHTVTGPTASFTLSRVFTNSSGSTITINEVGLYARSRFTTDTTGFFMIVRDIVSGGQAVLNTETATLEYKIGVTA